MTGAASEPEMQMSHTHTHMHTYIHTNTHTLYLYWYDVLSFFARSLSYPTSFLCVGFEVPVV